MSSSRANGSIPGHAKPFYEAIYREQEGKWRNLSTKARREQTVEDLTLRHLASYQEYVRDQLKAIPLTESSDDLTIAARLREVDSVASLDSSGLSEPVRTAFQTLVNLERHADQLVPPEQVPLFQRFVEGEMAEYGRELLVPSLRKKIIEEQAIARGRQEAGAQLTVEQRQEQSKRLERSRVAQKRIPQTLGLSEEEFDARLAADMHAAAQVQQLIRHENSSAPEDVRSALQRLERVGAALRELLEDRPVEGIRVRDVEYLSRMNFPEWLSRYGSLADSGYTLTALRASVPESINPDYVHFDDLVSVAETARIRGHGPGLVDGVDWLLTSVMMGQESS